MKTVNKIKSSFYFPFFIGLIFFGCSIDEALENKAPSNFKIEIDSISHNIVKIKWNKAIDPEKSIVFYDVFLNSEKKADNITKLSYTFEDLIDNKEYLCKIVASDPENNIRENSTSFTTLKNNAPTNFKISVNDTNPLSSIISWSESKDPEGETISYNVFLQDELLAKKIKTNSFNLPELKGLTRYSGKIEAFDRSGLKKIVPFFFTTKIKIYDDDITLSTQNSLDEFGNKGYNQINGNLTIGYNSSITNISDINNLTSLTTITNVTKNLIIQNTSCQDFSGLHNLRLTSNYPRIFIKKNKLLINCKGLDKITKAYLIDITDNEKLLNLTGLSSLTSVINYLWVVYNPSLESLTGLEGLVNVHSADISITNNDNLISLNGLKNLQQANELNINSNDKLKSLMGLSNFQKCFENLYISNNKMLNSVSYLSSLNSVKTIYITDNPRLKNLDGLEKLNDIRGSIQINRNNTLQNIDGIANIVFSNRNNDYHSIVINKNKQLTNLDGLSNLTFKEGKLNIKYNSSLRDFCGLKKLLSKVDKLSYDGATFIRYNLFNPNIDEIAKGNCSF